MTHAAGCAHCKAEARLKHSLTHRSPETQALIERSERFFAALDLDFQREREAELAALARGVRPVPGQWKVDQQRLAVAEKLPQLLVYHDLWHEEAVS